MWTESGVEHMLVYIYDEAGAPIGLQYRTSAYGVEEFDSFFFEKNLQGDIVAIYNENGVKIGQYQYDAWGNHSAKTLTTNTLERKIVYNYNPFRYRGYYYDLETGFYYLQSRYYNPEWCRFLNADVYVSTGQGLLGNNMYAYCNNNPVSNIDPKGTLLISIGVTFLALTGITAIGLFGAKKVAQNPPDFSSAAKIIDQRIQRIQMGILIIGAIGDAIAGAIEREAEETEANKQHNQAYFPANPYDFNPNGLIRKEYEGSGNGKIIKWFLPMTKIAIFEWDEDYEYGPHYHVFEGKDHTDVHYRAKDPVPEPWNSTFFGG